MGESDKRTGGDAGEDVFGHAVGQRHRHMVAQQGFFWLDLMLLLLLLLHGSMMLPTRRGHCGDR